MSMISKIGIDVSQQTSDKIFQIKRY